MWGQTTSGPVTLLVVPNSSGSRAANAEPDLSGSILNTLGRLPESRVDRSISAMTAPTEPPADYSPDNFTLPKKYRTQSKYDVSKIGERSVGKGVNFYSLDKEQALGRELATQVEMESKLLKDPKITEYVNRLGQNLARNSDAKVPFVIKVIDSDEVNAFALPGGFFYVNTGLIEAADSEAELAGVMAHEIAHVAARHATKNMTKGQIWNMASIPLIFVGGPVGFAVQEAAGLAVPMSFLKFTRDAEREADLLGMEYQYAAGYDPESFVTFFEKLKAQEKHKKNFIAKAFDTHPMTEDRVKRAQKEIEEVLPPKPQYIDDTSEFQEMKARLAGILNEHRLVKENASGRPTLRRAESKPDTTTPKKGGDDDDRPTLKRPTDNNN
jgi:beta-barrel assembly-enhancing protease